MATEQELNRAKEIAAIEKERIAIKEKQKDLDSDSVGLASSLVDSIKEIQGINSKRSTFDQNLLKVNKQIANEILNQRKGLQSIHAIDKQLLKNKEAILKYNTTGKGKIIKIISQWKSRGILCFDYNLLYDIFVKTTNCEFCNVELTIDTITTSTTRCLDHNHNITDRFNVRGVLCHLCNFKDVLKD